MKKQYMIFLIVIFRMLFPAEAVAEVDPTTIDAIKANYRNLLIRRADANDTLTSGLMMIKPETEMSDQVVIELHERYHFDIEKIERYLADLSADGSWNDINYADPKRSGWEPKQHADRVLEMVKVYLTPGTPLYASASLDEKIHRALGFWFAKRPKCANWWQNEIGVPKTLGPACLLIENELSDAEREGIIDVMEAAKFKMTGQNKVWLAGNVLVRGLLQNDPATVRMARDTIASEICVGRAEGIKNDWSFHQHGPQQQFGNYGLAYLTGMGFYYKLFSDTDFAFDPEQEEILRNFIENGYKWIIWNRRMDVSSLGRQLYHNAQAHKAYALAFTAAEFGIDGFPEHSNPLVGHMHFDESDYTVHRTPGWMASVKMSSSRVIGTEVVNEDNLLGYYLGDGATYFYVRGDEYSEVFPFLDWRKIPGVTAYEDEAPIPNIRQNKSRNRSALVGGLANGNRGMSAMAFDRDKLNARKAWVMTDDFVMCLGGCLASDSLRNVTTAIDTRLRSGDLLVNDSGEWRPSAASESHDGHITRIYHDSVGYVVMPGNALQIVSEKRSGSWNSFMKMYKPATIEDEVVSLHLAHGVAPKDASYLYFVLPASTPEKISAFNPDERVKVHRNDSIAQIVELNDPNAREIWAAVYEAAPLEIDGVSFAPPVPGVYCLKKSGETLDVVESSYFKI